ncbi:DnaJ domain-containing protein [bacterium]|nr:DnaJ domain-containing protein [bacterium]
MAKVLVVDHVPAKQSWLSKVLASVGHDAVCVATADEARGAVVREQPDALIVTMTLPKTPGSELALSIKKSAPGSRIPVILTSSIFKNMQLDKMAGDRWRVDVFLEEPYRKDDLLRHLAEQLERYASMSPDDEIDDVSPMGDDDISPTDETEVEVDPFEAMMDAADRAVDGVTSEADKFIAQDRAAARRAIGGTRSPGAALSLAPRGALEETSVPEIVAALFFAGATGVLTVRSAGREKKVFVRDGLPISVEGSVREETLGQVLRRYGRIDDETHARTLSALAELDRRQGDVLVDMGALSPAELFQALKIQAQEKLVATFDWFEGEYAWEAGPFETSEMTVFEMWPPLVLLQGILRFYGAASIREIFKEMKDFSLRRRDEAPVAYADLQFPAEVDALMETIDGRRSLAEVVVDSPLPAERTYQVLYALLLLRQFDKLDATVVAAGSTPHLPDANPSLDQLVNLAISDGLGDATSSLLGATDLSKMFTEGEAPAEPPTMAETAPVVSVESEPVKEEATFSFGDADDEDDEEEFVPEPDLEETTFDLGPAGGDVIEPDDESSPSIEIDIDDRDEDGGEPIPLSDDLSKALADFMSDVEAEDLGAVPSELEQSAQSGFDQAFGSRRIIDDDSDLDERGGESERAERSLAESFEMSEEDFAALKPEQQELLAQILQDYLALGKSNFYQVLKVKQGSSEIEIRSAYNSLLKKYHPDRLQEHFTGEALRKAGEITFKVTDAFRTLADPKRRKAYDSQLADGIERKERTIGMILQAENEFNMGLSAVKQHKWDTAKNHFAEAIELFPEEGEYHAYMGWVIYHLESMPPAERTQQARTFLERAIRLNPRSDKAYHFLGVLLKDNHMLDKAALMFAQAFRFNKNNREAKRQLQTLHALRYQEAQKEKEAREKAHSTAGQAAEAANNVLNKEVSLDSVKKAILKLFL